MVWHQRHPSIFMFKLNWYIFRDSSKTWDMITECCIQVYRGYVIISEDFSDNSIDDHVIMARPWYDNDCNLVNIWNINTKQELQCRVSIWPCFNCIQAWVWHLGQQISASTPSPIALSSVCLSVRINVVIRMQIASSDQSSNLTQICILVVARNPFIV